MARSSGHIFAAAASSSLVAAEEKDDAIGSRPAAIDQPKSETAAAMIPTHESLMAIKHKKKLLTNGTEQFNMKPSKVGLFIPFQSGLRIRVHLRPDPDPANQNFKNLIRILFALAKNQF